MIELTMKGIHPLNAETIDSLIPPGTIGNYVLGHQVNEHGIKIRYLGRSNTDLGSRLKDHIGEPYDSFMFNTQDTPDEAYIEECWSWHTCDGPQGEIDNKVHPAKPEGSTARCRVCGK